MFAVMKTFVTVILASTGRNDLIYGFGMMTCTVSPLSRVNLERGDTVQIKSFLPVEAEISVTKV
jgi:hypothetical protein